MSSRINRRGKKNNQVQKSTIFDSENGTCNFNGYKKHVIENPNMGSNNIEKINNNTLGLQSK